MVNALSEPHGPLLNNWALTSGQEFFGKHIKFLNCHPLWEGELWDCLKWYFMQGALRCIVLGLCIKWEIYSVFKRDTRLRNDAATLASTCTINLLIKTYHCIYPEDRRYYLGNQTFQIIYLDFPSIQNSNALLLTKQHLLLVLSIL